MDLLVLTDLGDMLDVHVAMSILMLIVYFHWPKYVERKGNYCGICRLF